MNNVNNSGANGIIYLEVSSTNSATPTNWILNGQNGYNTIPTSNSTFTTSITFQLSTYVPAGYYAKLRTSTVLGSITFTYIGGIEVLFG
jgi:hypothetical protein